MPYSVVKVVGGYKVQSDNGTMLSKKPMTRQKAEAQRISATLSYLKTER